MERKIPETVLLPNKAGLVMAVEVPWCVCAKEKREWIKKIKSSSWMGAVNLEYITTLKIYRPG
jgi:hypothetical protein